jgi:aminopeptidase
MTQAPFRASSLLAPILTFNSLQATFYSMKIGGSFHMALGAGYPETGSKNKSVIHWDMICDMRKDAEILVDGELFYKNGQFVFGKFRF